jgi:hypothetical protein
LIYNDKQFKGKTKFPTSHREPNANAVQWNNNAPHF